MRSSSNSAGVLRGGGHPGLRPSSTARYQTEFISEKSSAYAPSTSGGFLGRVSYSASSIFIVRDGSGKGRLNSSYFLVMLTSVAAHAAYRSPRERSTSTTFNNVGSTIGSDAGINVYHEFESGIRQVVGRLTPKVVSKMQEHTTHDHPSRLQRPSRKIAVTISSHRTVNCDQLFH